MTITLSALLQVGVPLGCMVWIAFGRPHSRAAWALVSAATGAWLIAGRLTGLWLFPPSWVPLALLVLLAGAITWGRSSLTRQTWRPHSIRGWTEVIIGLVLGALAGVGIATGITGRHPDGVPVGLRFPLRGGVYQIVNGGSTLLINAHRVTLSDPRFADWRGQSYGVDIVKVNALGLRASGIAPADPGQYAIFNDDVYSPCDGVVIETADGVADMPAGQRDRSHMAGNYALLECGDSQVLLGHLRRGSVRVASGDRVTLDTVLGQVGNSGNTDEPHLHIHAQHRSPQSGRPIAGDPVPIQFDGRFLARNDSIDTTRVRAPTPSRGWTPAVMMYAQIGSSVVALAMLVVSLWSPRWGRLLFSALFAWAAAVNWRTAIDQPAVYLEYAGLAILPLYRDFILGFFARHITAFVVGVAMGQALISILLLTSQTFQRIALAGAVVFLLAIVPLGVGAGFPATLIMALAAVMLMRRSPTQTASVVPSKRRQAPLNVA